MQTFVNGINTDPYQPIEKIRNYKGLSKGIHEIKHPVDIVTQGSLVERNIDLASCLAREGLKRVGVSVITLNASLARKLEPRAA